MIIRSKAPLRIGLAGGGTDLAQYSDKFGGAVLNATIEMYAYCTIIPRSDGKIKIRSYDNGNDLFTDAVSVLPIEGDNLILHRGVYNRVVKEFNGGKPLSFEMSTSNDAPVGSGLGTSSTMVVAILEAFNRWLGLNLDPYGMAALAYDIERNDLKLAGGKQDQYAAAFGGFNFIEFKKNGSVVVNSLRFDKGRINELESSLLLYYGGCSRSSAKVQLELTKNIINNQIESAKQSESRTLNAMTDLKQSAYDMKDYLFTGDMQAFAESMRLGWEQKKRTSDIVSNKQLEETISFVLSHGAEAVKVSGAGGGGFLLVYCNPVNRQTLIDETAKLPGKTYPVSFSKNGAQSWIINDKTAVKTERV